MTPRVFLKAHGWIDAAWLYREEYKSKQVTCWENFGPLKLANLSHGTICRLARCIEEYGMAFAVWANYVGFANASVESFEDAYIPNCVEIDGYTFEVQK